MLPEGSSSPETNARLLTFAFHLQLLVELDRLFFSAIKGRKKNSVASHNIYQTDS